MEKESEIRNYMDENRVSWDPSNMQLVQGESGTGLAETGGHEAKEAVAEAWEVGWDTGNKRESSEWQESNVSPFGQNQKMYTLQRWEEWLWREIHLGEL